MVGLSEMQHIAQKLPRDPEEAASAMINDDISFPTVVAIYVFDYVGYGIVFLHNFHWGLAMRGQATDVVAMGPWRGLPEAMPWMVKPMEMWLEAERRDFGQ